MKKKSSFVVRSSD